MLSQLKQNVGNPQGPATSQDILDLAPLIDQSTLECLNQNDAHPVGNAFFDCSPTSCLLSDCDPQLLIRLQFKQPVKLYFLELTSTSKDAYPLTLKLFANTTKLEFEECESTQPTQVRHPTHHF